MTVLHASTLFENLAHVWEKKVLKQDHCYGLPEQLPNGFYKIRNACNTLCCQMFNEC